MSLSPKGNQPKRYDGNYFFTVSITYSKVSSVYE